MIFEQITVKELYELCKAEIARGNGNKFIVISDDNEGNGYHGLFYGFAPVDDTNLLLIYDSTSKTPEEIIVLG